MKKIFVCAMFAALAACNSQEEAPAPEPTPTVAAAPVVKPSLPAPDESIFADVYAAACPNAEPVSTSLCKSQGLGKEGFVCDYGLGDDEYRRNTATLLPGDGEWTLDDPENSCAA